MPKDQVQDSGVTLTLEEDPDSGAPRTLETAEPEGSPSDAPPDEGGDDKGTQPDGDKKTQKRVLDTQTALRDVQRDLHSASEQYKELMAAVAEERGKLAALQTQRAEAEPETPDPFDGDEAEQHWRQKHEADPLATQLEMARVQRAQFATILKERDSALVEQMRDIVTDAVNPARTELAEELAEVKKDERFKNLDSKTQLAIAQKYHEAKPKKRPTPPGSPAGTGRTVAQPRPDEVAEREKAAKAEADKLFGPLEPEGKPGVVKVEGLD